MNNNLTFILLAILSTLLFIFASKIIDKVFRLFGLKRHSTLNFLTTHQLSKFFDSLISLLLKK